MSEAPTGEPDNKAQGQSVHTETSGTLIEQGWEEDTENLGTRKRIPTEKGLEEENRRLKTKKIAALSAVSRKRNELTRLMADDGNLHVIKGELQNINSLFKEFQEAHNAYYDRISESEQDNESRRYDEKEKSFLELREQIASWVCAAEHRLADHLESPSEVGSRVSRRSRATSVASSTASARAREKAKVAELMAERALLKKTQALQAAQEEMRLELAIVKAPR